MVIGNILGFIGSILMIYSGTLLEKKKILLIEIIQMSIFAFGNLLVGGYHGMLVNLLNICIDVLCYHGKLNLFTKSGLTIGMLLLQINMMDTSFLGTAVILVAVINLWFMNTKNLAFFKSLSIIAMVIWLFYDLSVGLYTSVAFDFATILVNLTSIYRLRKLTKDNDIDTTMKASSNEESKSFEKIIKEKLEETMEECFEEPLEGCLE